MPAHRLGHFTAPKTNASACRSSSLGENRFDQVLKSTIRFFTTFASLCERPG